MPELHFSVRWPDGSVQRCYPPSREQTARPFRSQPGAQVTVLGLER